MYSCHSILECYNLFSGVGLSMRSFSFIIGVLKYHNRFKSELDLFSGIVLCN